MIKFPVSTCAKLQDSKEKQAIVLVSKQSGVSNPLLKLPASSKRYLMHFVIFCGWQIFPMPVFWHRDNIEVWQHTTLIPSFFLQQNPD